MAGTNVNNTSMNGLNHDFHTVNINHNAKAHLGDAHYHIQIQGSSLDDGNIPSSFNVSDVSDIVNLAWKLYKECRTAPASFSNISDDLNSLRAVLQECEEVFSKVTRSESQALRLQTITNGCQVILEDLKVIVDNYQNVGLSTRRTWERLKWCENDVSQIRTRIATHISMLTAFMSTSQYHVEQKLNALLREFREGRMEGSVISSLTVDSLSQDEAAQWRAVRKELQDHGITIDMFQANIEFIFNWFSNAVASGAFEETYPDQTLSSQDATSSQDTFDPLAVETDENRSVTSIADAQSVDVSVPRPSSLTTSNSIVRNREADRYNQTPPSKRTQLYHRDPMVARLFSALTSGKIHVPPTAKRQSNPIAMMKASLARPQKAFQKAINQKDVDAIADILKDDYKTKLLTQDNPDSLNDAIRVICHAWKDQPNLPLLQLVISKGGDAALALKAAVRARNIVLCRVVIKNYERLNLDSALRVACDVSDPEIVKLLLEAGAQPGASAINAAVSHENVNILEALFAAGADPNSLDQKGRTPLEELICIRPNKDTRILRLLIEHGAKHPHPRSKKNLLEVAVRRAQSNVVSVLMEYQSELNISESHMRVAFAVAWEEERELLNWWETRYKSECEMGKPAHPVVDIGNDRHYSELKAIIDIFIAENI